MKRFFCCDLPVGRVGICEEDGAVTSVEFGGSAPAGAAVEETPLITMAASQLREYFRGERKSFDLPLAPRGTQFQLKVWAALREIPYGQTRSYGQIAQAVGNPKACRAVGMANNRNPIAIIVPCHRVIGADGSLTGYAGGLETKRFLLELERR